MLRTLTITTATIALAMPALAAENSAAPTKPADVSAHAQALSSDYEAKQAHNILAGRGYVNISSLDRDESGRWVGTATKDGKTIYVSVVLPHPQAGATN